MTFQQNIMQKEKGTCAQSKIFDMTKCQKVYICTVPESQKMAKNIWEVELLWFFPVKRRPETILPENTLNCLFFLSLTNFISARCAYKNKGYG